MTDTPRYCVDCAFFVIGEGFASRKTNLSAGRCLAPQAVSHDPDKYISPELVELPYASSKRQKDCGPEAKWFQPRIKEAAE
jgi:hypothetical protein